MSFTNKEKLKMNYEYISSIYGEDSVLGIFSEDKEMTSMKAIIVPSLEELCFGRVGGLIHKDGKVIVIEDICIFVSNYLLHNTFPTDLCLFNKKYLDLTQNFEKKDADVKSIAIELIKRRIESNEDIQLNLTPSEEDAFNELCKKIGREGIVSINNLSKETMISRPVYNSLINKLEKAKAVVVKNVGARGTYIKIINKKLIEERGI